MKRDPSDFGDRSDQQRDFETLLSTLLGWLGREVEASVHDAASLGDLARLNGTLCAPATEDGDGDNERLMFPLGPGKKSGIVIDRVSFQEAEICETHISVVFGSAVLEIEVV